MASTNALFLDTSIVISRSHKAPSVRTRIKSTLQNFNHLRIGLVVRQEYKRRVLGEAVYLYGLCEKLKSITEISGRINRLRDPGKKNISLDLLNVYFPSDSEAELVDRLRDMLLLLLLTGTDSLDKSVDEIVRDSGCGLGKVDIKSREKRDGSFDFDMANRKCSTFKSGECGVAKFVSDNRTHIARIRECLLSIPPADVTKQLRETINFIDLALADPQSAPSANPCLTVGDLLIALESASTETFYTLNGKESVHLCKALRQKLIVSPTNPETAETVHDFSH